MARTYSLNPWKNKGIGWKTRHLIVILLSVAGTYAFLESRAEWSEMHRWNRAIGDMSLVLIAFSMALGPITRLFNTARPILPFRREFGIWGVILAIIHLAIILVGWVEWDLWRLFGFELHPAGMYVMTKHGFGLANAIGLLALGYGLILALSSSDWSQRILGGPTWKFLQQSSYVLWMLIVLHTAYFLYLNFLDYHRSVPDPNWAQLPFALLVTAVSLLQLAAFIKTWRMRRSNASSGKMRGATSGS